MEEFEKYFNEYKVTTRDSASEEYFSASIRIALDKYNLEITELVDSAGISRGTVDKWSKGKSLPPASSRKSFLERILEKI